MAKLSHISQVFDFLDAFIILCAFCPFSYHIAFYGLKHVTVFIPFFPFLFFFSVEFHIDWATLYVKYPSTRKGSVFRLRWMLSCS